MSPLRRRRAPALATTSGGINKSAVNDQPEMPLVSLERPATLDDERKVTLALNVRGYEETETLRAFS
jgi:hypothetical protein